MKTSILLAFALLCSQVSFAQVSTPGARSIFTINCASAANNVVLYELTCIRAIVAPAHNVVGCSIKDAADQTIQLTPVSQNIRTAVYQALSPSLNPGEFIVTLDKAHDTATITSNITGSPTIECR